MTQTGKMLDMAKKMVEAAEKKAIEIDVPMVIAVCDMGGNLVLCHRMEDSLLASLSIAQDKAFTSVSLKMPSATVYDVAKEAGPLFGLETTCDGRIVSFGGGIPIMEGDKIIGAIGVSGGSVEEDVSVAEAGLAAL